MENYKLVMPENLNHYGYLFGGYMLKWVDEIAWIAASLDYPDSKFVTIAMDKVEFRNSVGQGTILRFTTECVKVGNTSLNFRVNVDRDSRENSSRRDIIFTTVVTLVRVDAKGNKTPIRS